MTQKLSRAQQREYQREMEYHYDTHPQPQHDPHAEEREEMEYHYRTNPTTRERVENVAARARGVSERAINVGRDVARQGAGIARGIYDTGSALNSALERGGHDPMIRQVASGSGFSMSRQAPPRQQPRGRRGDIRQNPGETIRITRCDESGNCRTTTLKGGSQSQPRRRSPRWAAGTLGGDDPGFF